MTEDEKLIRNASILGNMALSYNPNLRWVDLVPSEIKAALDYALAELDHAWKCNVLSNCQVVTESFTHRISREDIINFWKEPDDKPISWHAPKCLCDIEVMADERTAEEAGIRHGIGMMYSPLQIGTNLVFFAGDKKWTIKFPTSVEYGFMDTVSMRLVIFCWLHLREFCSYFFSDSAIYWPFDPSNLECVLDIFRYDTEHGGESTLELYLKRMGDYGLEFEDLREVTERDGYNELLIRIIRILGVNKHNEEQPQFRL